MSSSKKRRKERHGEYTDKNWWIGRVDVRVLVNKQMGLLLNRRRAYYSTFFPFIVSLNFAIAAPQCFSRRPRLSKNNSSSLSLLFITYGDQGAWQWRGLPHRGGRGQIGRCQAKQVWAGQSRPGRSGAWGRWPDAWIVMYLYLYWQVWPGRSEAWGRWPAWSLWCICICICICKCEQQAPSFSGILIPGFSGRDFCKIPGSRDFLGRD